MKNLDSSISTAEAGAPCRIEQALLEAYRAHDWSGWTRAALSDSLTLPDEAIAVAPSRAMAVEIGITGMDEWCCVRAAGADVEVAR